MLERELRYKDVRRAKTVTQSGLDLLSRFLVTLIMKGRFPHRVPLPPLSSVVELGPTPPFLFLPPSPSIGQQKSNPNFPFCSFSHLSSVDPPLKFVSRGYTPMFLWPHVIQLCLWINPPPSVDDS